MTASWQDFFMEVVGDFNVRGNIKTIVRAPHRDATWSGEADPWWSTEGNGALTGQ